MNCQKSNRKCERGVRLNFIDLKVEQPPILLPPVDWKGQCAWFIVTQMRASNEGSTPAAGPAPSLGLIVLTVRCSPIPG